MAQSQRRQPNRNSGRVPHALPLRRFPSQRSSFSSSSVQGATRRSSFSSSSVQGATKAEEDEDKPFNCFRLRQFKGEGKGGSLGVAVGTAKKPEPATRNDAIPPALPANTLQDVQDMFDSGYYAYPETPFWDGRNIGGRWHMYPLLVEKRANR